MLSGKMPNGNDAQPPSDKASEDSSLIEMLLRQASGKLDHIEEPTAAELEALEQMEAEPFDDDLALPNAEEAQPALAILAQLDEPELVSLEGLDDAEAIIEADGDEVEELLDEAESLIEDYIDADLEDDELEDEGYDLDDEEFGSYRDLYGEDDTIIPSFREGEFVEEEDGDTDYYNELR